MQFANGSAIDLSQVPSVPVAALAGAARAAREQQQMLASLQMLDGRLLLLLADAATGRLSARSFELAGARTWPSITPAWPAAQLFEREIFERTGARPEGHPWLKSVRRHGPGLHPFLRAEGEGVHEVAVGPIHAGIIEPGHFRFQCEGELVLHLEIQLGWQTRGAEQMLLHPHPGRRLRAAESIAGDTSVGHALAYCTAIEALSGTKVPLRAQALRGVLLELERIANHVGDLGMLCNDVGYLPGSAYFGRMRGDFLNVMAEISGNRLGRGLLVPGGVRFDVSEEMLARIHGVLAKADRDLNDTARVVFSTPSVLSRFEGTGTVTRAQAEELGVCGVAARACGLRADTRSDHPVGIFQFAHVPVAVAEDGDVMARSTVRWLEVLRSMQFVGEQLEQLPPGPLRVAQGALRGSSLAVAMIEGWRGAIVHVARTGADGSVVEHKVVDPSFRNWKALELAVRGAQISDFPLCNKSFNLSYAGHDL
ncbi:MAG TPA: NADH-quinone oxidoreductase subunit C [Myxococcales bacterium]|nr:NADH-quinone oxidoreductase subunit C [Myxococcales bacterium]